MSPYATGDSFPPEKNDLTETDPTLDILEWDHLSLENIQVKSLADTDTYSKQ